VRGDADTGHAGGPATIRPWTTETLDEFLANPNAKVPDTVMIRMLVDPQRRAEMIAYLATLKQ
jgi:cytochrome c2